MTGRNSSHQGDTAAELAERFGAYRHAAESLGDFRDDILANSQELWPRRVCSRFATDPQQKWPADGSCQQSAYVFDAEIAATENRRKGYLRFLAAFFLAFFLATFFLAFFFVDFLAAFFFAFFLAFFFGDFLAAFFFAAFFLATFFLAFFFVDFLAAFFFAAFFFFAI